MRMFQLTRRLLRKSRDFAIMGDDQELTNATAVL